MVPALITLGSDSSFWFQLTQGQFGDYLIAQEWRGEEKRPCRAAAMECVGEELLKKADGFSLSFLLLFLRFFFLNSVEQTTQQHIFHHQSFAEENSPLLFHFFLMFTGCKANGLWSTGRADLSWGHSRGLAQHPWCTTAFSRWLAARGSAPASAFGCWVPNVAPQLATADTGIWDMQRFADVHDLHL